MNLRTEFSRSLRASSPLLTLIIMSLIPISPVIAESPVDAIKLQLEIRSISVKGTKPDGQKWDLLGAPDVKTEVWVDGQIIKAIGEKKNALKVTYSDAFTPLFDYIEGKTSVQIKVYDHDIKQDDLIGIIEPMVGVAPKKPTQRLRLAGGRIAEMVVLVKLDPAYVAEHMNREVAALEVHLNALISKIKASQDQEEASSKRATAAIAAAEAAEARAQAFQRSAEIAEMRAKGATDEAEAAKVRVEAALKKAKSAELKASKAEGEAKQSEQVAQEAERLAIIAAEMAEKAEADVKDREGKLATTRKQLESAEKKLSSVQEKKKALITEANRRIDLAKKATKAATERAKQALKVLDKPLK